MGKFAPKIQNCLFKVKFDTKTNSNLQNSMVVYILSVLDCKYLPYFEQIGLKKLSVSAENWY